MWTVTLALCAAIAFSFLCQRICHQNDSMTNTDYTLTMIMRLIMMTITFVVVVVLPSFHDSEWCSAQSWHLCYSTSASVCWVVPCMSARQFWTFPCVLLSVQHQMDPHRQRQPPCQQCQLQQQKHLNVSVQPLIISVTIRLWQSASSLP